MSSPEIDQEGPRESFKVQFWAIREYKGARGTTYTVRWVVGGKGGTTHPETFQHKGLAESRLAQVRTLAKQGEPFDLVTGLPMREVRAALAKAAKEEKPSGPTWYEHSLSYIARRGPGLSGNSMRSVAETLAGVTPVLLTPDAGRPADRVLRAALYGWAFRGNAGDPPEDVAAVLAWVSAHSRLLADLNDDQDLVLDALNAISVKLDGTPAKPNTVSRKHAVLSNVLDFGIGRGLDVNPLPAVKKAWTLPEVTQTVDPRVVVNNSQARHLLIAVSYQGRMGPQLVAFFACMYYAGARPGEVVELREDDLDLPVNGGWGMIYLHGSAPSVGSGFSRSGRRRDPRQLKHRAEGEVRPVPCHPLLTQHLLAHISEFGTTRDGRLFRGERGGDLSESVYSRVWSQARGLALSPSLARTPIAGRPYDLRHACLSAWLNNGVEQTQVAEWAGNSVKVLMDTYAKCIHGHDEINRKRMEVAFSDILINEASGRQSPERQAVEALARALARHDAKLALKVVTGGVRWFLAQAGVDESTLPGDVKIALRQADDVIGGP